MEKEARFPSVSDAYTETINMIIHDFADDLTVNEREIAKYEGRLRDLHDEQAEIGQAIAKLEAERERYI